MTRSLELSDNARPKVWTSTVENLNCAGDLVTQVHPRPRKDNYPESPTVCKIPRPVPGVHPNGSWSFTANDEYPHRDKHPHAQLDTLYNKPSLPSCAPPRTGKEVGHATTPAGTQWPPEGLKSMSKISAKDASALICNGILSFRGLPCQANYNDAPHIRFYASVTLERLDSRHGMVDQLCQVPADMSLQLFNITADGMPWETLEQPSMTYCFGLLPGTVTLNRYIGLINQPIPSVPFPYYTIMARQTDDLIVLRRLYDLQSRMGCAFDAAEAEILLFTQLLLDPDWVPGVPETIDRQIAVLIAALDNPIWLDFRDPALHCLAKYYDSQNPRIEQLFYQQLLLSVELYMRILFLTQWVDLSQRLCIIGSIPEKVAYDLALAQIWQSKMRLEPLDDIQNPTMFHIMAITKDIQKLKLLGFAKTMEWPGIANVEAMLEETHEGEIPLECKSAHSATWISGVLLPGPSISWLIMRSLIDCDPRVKSDQPGFKEMYANLGFQYDGSTYWYWQCIVGKVLGACKGVKQEYGWVGPCLTTKDVNRRHSILIQAEKPTNAMTKSNVKSMSARTSALGPPTDTYPVDEYIIPLPNLANTVDSVSFLELKLSDHVLPSDPSQPEQYSSSLGFAINSKIGWMRLRYDVSFISCPPCKGQHVLFWDYVYDIVDIIHLLTRQISWNSISIHDPTPADATHDEEALEKKLGVPESVLVVEAYGKEDNEVIARAWASHIGFSAVVANVNQTCMACSIRMAYAACVPMLILTNRDLEKKDQLPS